MAVASRRYVSVVWSLLVVVVFVLVGMVVLGFWDRSPLPGFGLAAAMVIGLLGLLAVLMRQVVRQRVVGAIAGGEERLEVDEFRGVRETLSSRRHRLRLAGTLDSFASAAPIAEQRLSAIRAPAFPRAAACPVMRELAGVLRQEPPPPLRVVAICEQLLTDGHASPLYRNQPDALARELGRVRYLAASRQRSPPQGHD